MSDMGFTPNLIASATVNPFRFVVVSGAFTGAQAAAGTVVPVGVSDGSVYLFGQTAHAPADYPITIQPTNTVQIELGSGGITAGGYIMPDANGKGIAHTGTGAYSCYVALEAGAENAIVRAFRTGTIKA